MNELILAVAGGRKTQSIVDACRDGDTSRRRLVLTYTVTGQQELENRLERECPAMGRPVVMGWYQFLLAHWLRPFLSLYFAGRELGAFNFDGQPAHDRFSLTDHRRFFDASGGVYALHLARLSLLVAEASEGAVLDRLSRIYDEIWVDEVQDLTGCDLHVLAQLMAAPVDLHLVGDLRQSVVETNARDQNLKQYKGLAKVEWYRERQADGVLTIVESNDTYRSSQAIADLSDSVLPERLGFPATTSRVDYRDQAHEGVFLVRERDVMAYVAAYAPRCLRDRVTTFKHLDIAFTNFGKVKGQTEDHVLIAPNGTIRKHLVQGAVLKDRTACQLYVGITRARYSVAFILDDEQASIPAQVWEP